MKTQNDKILEYIKKHGSITQLEAARDIGCFRLSARIWELRRAGHDIGSTNVTRKHADGSVATFARYYLKRETATPVYEVR